MIRIQEPGLEVLDPKHDIVMPEGFRDSGGRYNAEIMEEVGRKVIHLLEEIYGRKASPEIWALNGYSRGERQTNYAALAAALFSFFRDCAQKNQSAIIRLPYGLGCGLAGGDWNTVLAIINDAAKAWNLNIEIWELQQ